jgi:hypothetical protein
MDDWGKEQLDSVVGQAVETLRGERLSLLEEQYAALTADLLARQFPDVPDLGRVVVACAQHMAALGAQGAHSAVLVNVLGHTGLHLIDGAPEEKPGG